MTMISTVLRNIISNALKFSYEGEEIVICFKAIVVIGDDTILVRRGGRQLK